MTTPHKKPPPLGIRAAAVLVSAVWDTLNVLRHVLACNDRGKTLTFKQQWPERAFTIRDGVADPRIIIIKGRNRWALENLMRAGSKGCTPIDHSGWGWSAYVFNLKKVGISIETITELHGGPFARHHARYVLRPGWEDWTMTALRIAFLCRHYGIHADRAAMLAALIWGAGHE